MASWTDELYDAVKARYGATPTAADVKKFEETGIPYVKGKPVTDKPVVPIKGGKPVINTDTVKKIKDTKPAKKVTFAPEPVKAKAAPAKKDLSQEQSSAQKFWEQLTGQRITLADAEQYKKTGTPYSMGKPISGTVKIPGVSKGVAVPADVAGGVEIQDVPGVGTHILFETLNPDQQKVVSEAGKQALKSMAAGVDFKDALKPLTDFMKSLPKEELSRPQLKEVLKDVAKPTNALQFLEEAATKGFKEELTRPQLREAQKAIGKLAPEAKAAAELRKGGYAADVSTPLLEETLAGAAKPVRAASPIEALQKKGYAPTTVDPLLQAYATELTKGARQLGYKPIARAVRKEYQRLQPELGAQYLNQGTRFSGAFQGAQKEAEANLAERLGLIKAGLKREERSAQRTALPSLVNATEQQRASELGLAQAAAPTQLRERELQQNQLSTLLSRLGTSEEQQRRLAELSSHEAFAGGQFGLENLKTLLGQRGVEVGEQNKLYESLAGYGNQQQQLRQQLADLLLREKQAQQGVGLKGAGALTEASLRGGATGLEALKTGLQASLTPTKQSSFQPAAPSFGASIAPGLGYGIGGAIGTGATYGLKALINSLIPGVF